MTGHCWWGGDLSYPGTTSGALCWRAPSSTSTGAAMMWPTVHCTHLVGLSGEDRGTLPRGGIGCCEEQPQESIQVQVFPGAAPGAAPGCQVLGIGADTPAAHHPTRH